MSGWTLFPHLVVRTTGFPFDWVERLRTRESAEATQAVRDARARVDALRRSGARIKRPTRAVLSALKAGRQVDLSQVEDPSAFDAWNAEALSLEQAEAALDLALQRDESRSVQALRELAAEPRFAEAIASSSPPVYLDIVRGRWGNRLDRQVASYLQRLCAKNETMSFFGPINYGTCDFTGEDGVALEWPGPQVLRGRRTHMASWLVQGLWRRIAFDPAVTPWLVLRRKGFNQAPTRRARRALLGEILIRLGLVPAENVVQALERQARAPERRLGEVLVDMGACSPANVERGLAVQAGGAVPALSADGAPADQEDLVPRMVQEADGSRNLKALAEDLGLEFERAVALARICCDRGLLTHQLEIPAAAAYPLNDLVDRLAGLPGEGSRRELERVSQLLRWLNRYSEAPAGEKVRLNEEVAAFAREAWEIEGPVVRAQPSAAEAEQRSRRGEGHNFYADRLPLREECGGEMRLKISGARARELQERCGGALALMGVAALRSRVASQRSLARLVGARRLPFWKVVAAFSDHPVEVDPAVGEALQAAVDAPLAREVELRDRLVVPSGPAQTLPLVTSVDVLVAASDPASWAVGNYQLVMGDVHDTPLVRGWALQFHPDRDQVETELLTQMGLLRRPVPMVTVLASRRTGLPPAELPGPVVELGGVSLRSSAWRLPFDDLVVESNGVTARLVSVRMRSEVALYNGELESLAHAAFAVPRIRPLRLDLGAHTPRLLLDGVVVQREQWRLGPEEVQTLLAGRDDRARLAACLALWERRGLPTMVFAKFSGERKPILLDAQSMPGIRVFMNLLDQKRDVVLSELLPGPGGLWLSGPLGRHTAELRCVFMRGGEPG